MFKNLDFTGSTNIVATAAVVSPWWLSIVYDVSAVAGVLLPVLGCLWLGMQMYTHFRNNYRKGDPE